MKKTLQILFFSALSVAGMAQKKAVITQSEGPKAVSKVHEGVDPKIDRSSQFPTTSDNRVVVFHETFESGFAGSTTFGAWTHSHNLTGVPSNQGSMWSIGTPTYVNVYGNGTAGSDALVSASPAQWALWDGAQYLVNFPNSLPASAHYSGFLNAPELDFSELETVLVDFQQVFRYCCFPDSPISLDVSVDGGTSWTSFNAIGNAIEGANIQSVNPLNTTIDISCVAAGEASVKLRFAYNSAEESGYSHYFWGIDEVKVYTNDFPKDLFIKEISNGNILNDWEHRVTPAEQIRGVNAAGPGVGGIVVGALVGNRGSETQSDVKVKFTFTKPGGGTIEYTTPPFELYSALTDTVCPHLENAWFFWNTNIVIDEDELGVYGFEALIYVEGDAENTNDATPADNRREETLNFNDIAEYGHDGDAAADFQWQIGSRLVNDNQPNGPRDQTGFGSHYSFTNSGSVAHGITVRFGSNTVAGVEFRAALIHQTDASMDNSPLVASGNYETRDGWNTSEPLFFAFNDDIPVGGVYPAEPYSPLTVFQPGVTASPNYVAAIWRQTSGLGQMTVRAQETNDVDLSSVAWEKGGDQAFHWFHFQEYNYAVRLILSAPYINHIPISTEEIETAAVTFSVYPNPAVNETRVAFSLQKSSFIAYEVRDLQGRLMDTDNVGRFSQGNNSFSLNVAKYPAGNYIVGLVVDGEQFFTQQMSVVR